MEHPDVPRLLRLCHEGGIDLATNDTTFFLGRETLEIGNRPTMARWRKRLFAWMSQNAYDASAHFRIPTDKVVEVGVRLEI
jgi:KUP system potassium uptake protein